jgi:hypothetical protein
MSVAVSRLDASCVRKEEEVAVLEAVLSKHDDGKHRCTSPQPRLSITDGGITVPNRHRLFA